MAASDYPNNTDGFLRGIFGSLVEAAGRNAGTAEIWSTIKGAANDWASSTLAVTAGENVTDQMIADKVTQLIGHVTIQDVNQYRSIAGQAARAQQVLEGLAPNEQITAGAIFQAPWAKTADNPAIPTRYRIRVLRNITVSGFTAIEREEWATYDLGSVLTTTQDALDQADDLFNQAKYNKSASINRTLAYTIEAI